MSIDFVPPKEKSQKHCFKVKYNTGVKYFSAEKEQDMKSWMEFFKIDFPKFLSEDDNSKSFGGGSSSPMYIPTPLPTSKSESILSKEKKKLTKEDIQRVKYQRKTSWNSSSPGRRDSLNLLQNTPLGRSLSKSNFIEELPTEEEELNSTYVDEDEYTTKDICGPQDGFDCDEEGPSPVIEVKKKKQDYQFENFIFNLQWAYEEDEIATCAAEILKKDPIYRTNEEQAYVLALEDYQRKLSEHMKKNKTKPLHNKATATCIFTIPKEERTKKELEYTNDIELYLNYVCKEIHYLPPDLYQRVIQDSIEIFNKPKEQRNEKEQLYVEKISLISREIYVHEIQTGLVSHPTLLHEL